jgi:uncharacterized protein (TIGR02145 family)
MRLLLIVYFVLVSLEYSYAQKVTNITAEQVGQTIQVSYNLETESPCTVSLFYSTDNVSTWQGPLKKVSGDVGEKISNGIKRITWDVLNEMDQLKFSSVVFKVVARKPVLIEVEIGNQIWSAENLNTDRFANGAIIPEAKSVQEWNMVGKTQQPAWCYYNFNSSLGLVYGKLYNWYAVADTRGLCPMGWHVPSSNEWTILETHLGGSLVAGGKMKELNISHWENPNLGATNSSSFNGLPAGFIGYDGVFGGITENSDWWGDTQVSETSAVDRNLYYGNSILGNYISNKSNGLSVRCIKD